VAIVARIRERIPHQYKAQPYPPKTPEKSKMSSKFNKAGFGSASKTLSKNPVKLAPN